MEQAEGRQLSRRSREKAIIFSVSLAVKLAIGFIFYGSIDVTNSISGSMVIFNHHVFDYIPYLPVIPAFIWFGGLLNIITPLPLTFCYKLIPILFDSLLALLVYDIVERKNAKGAFGAGLLYALSPVAIIVNCLHSQWDSIFLFFVVLCFYIRDFYRDTWKKYFLYGIVFGFSFMVKPVSLILLPVFFEPLPQWKKGKVKKYLLHQASAAAGLLTVTGVCFALFILFGYDIMERLRFVLGYSNEGVQIIGLLYEYPLNRFPFLFYRFWILGVLVVMSGFYYLKKLEVFDIVLFSFAFSIGMSGISPQYLIWLVPLLLIMHRNRLGAIYSLVVTAFYLVYYINPYMSPTHWENMSTFGALKGFEWLMPPAELTYEKWMPTIRLLGNYLVPLSALIIALFIAVKAFTGFFRKDVAFIYRGVKQRTFSVLHGGYILPNIALWVTLGLIYLVLKGKELLPKLTAAYDQKIAQYSMVKHGEFYTGTYGGLSFLNITFILLLLSLCWSAYSYFMAAHAPPVAECKAKEAPPLLEKTIELE